MKRDFRQNEDTTVKGNGNVRERERPRRPALKGGNNHWNTARKIES